MDMAHKCYILAKYTQTLSKVCKKYLFQRKLLVDYIFHIAVVWCYIEVLYQEPKPSNKYVHVHFIFYKQQFYKQQKLD